MKLLSNLTIFRSTTSLKRNCRRNGWLGKLGRNSFDDCSKVGVQAVAAS